MLINIFMFVDYTTPEAESGYSSGPSTGTISLIVIAALALVIWWMTKSDESARVEKEKEYEEFNKRVREESRARKQASDFKQETQSILDNAYLRSEEQYAEELELLLVRLQNDEITKEQYISRVNLLKQLKE